MPIFHTNPAPGLRAMGLGLSCLMLWACTTPVTPSGSAAAPALEGERWSLVALGGTALAPETPLARVPYVELREGRLAGSSGCNRVMAQYQLDRSALRLGQGVGTRMMCTEGMEVEQQFLGLFPKVAAWRPAGDGVEWLDTERQVLTRFSSAIRAYRCDDGSSVLARFVPDRGSGPSMLLALEGKQYAMRSAPSASGARYVIERGRRTDWSMEWHGKGDEALLLEAPLSDDRKPEDLKVFARCRAV